MRATDRKETVDERLIKSSTDRLLPIRHREKMLKSLPNRAQARKENELPTMD
jgi:hypothetical protein